MPDLANLHDIHLPAPITKWPLAPGWYVLAVLLLLSVAGGIFLVKRWHRRSQPKREALHLLKVEKEALATSGDAQRAAARVSAVLKRVAMVYFPREQIAGLTGEAWLQFLMTHSKGLNFKAVEKELLILPYQPLQEHHLDLLFQLSAQWIKQRSRRCWN